MKGKAQTVLGPINPEELGRVLPHEHFEIKLGLVFHKESLFDSEKKNCDFVLKNLGWIRQFPYSHFPNMTVRGDVERNAILEEMRIFKSCGGGTVVDNSTINIGFQEDRAEFAKEVTQETGVHVITGTGYYVTSSQTEATLRLTEESMAAHMTQELSEGCQEVPSVKCGIIGEIGISQPITDFERRTLRASAQVEASLGCPVMIHPGRDSKSPEEIVRIFTEAGGNAKRVTMAHLDRTLLREEDVLEFATLGTFLEYDLFGIETSYYQQNESMAMPTDAQRIDFIQSLMKEGYEDRILISHDIHTKHRMQHFGGHGFSHILNVVVPMMLKKGISQDVIDKFLISNPADWLTFTK